MKLVLIAGNNYVFVPLRMSPIVRGEVITVDDETLGQQLLAQRYKDRANNYHPYFVETTDERAARFVKDEDREPAKAAPKRRRRKAVAKPAPSAEAATE